MKSTAEEFDYLFEQINLNAVESPIVFDCSTSEDLFSLVRDALVLIRERLYHAGFYQEPAWCLVIPSGNHIPEGIEALMDVFEHECGDSAYLFTFKIGNVPIITLPHGMNWLDWSYAVQKGEKPSLIVTMPWAQARFVNWKKEKVMMKKKLRHHVKELIRGLIRDREVYQRQPWTCVVLTVQVNGEFRKIFDFSKVQYPDAWDSERGIELAEQKAISAFAKELIREDPAGALDIGQGASIFIEGSAPWTPFE